MRFYSYSNTNDDYIMAISLENISSIHMMPLLEGMDKSVIRFIVEVNYMDGRKEQFRSLEKEEAKELLGALVKLLNK